jgi:hypothetical protein
MTYSDEELEPQFDPLDPKLIKKVDWEELREVLDAFWDQSEGWKRLISRNIENPSLTKFVNFYIYFHIDSIAQEILEGADKTKAERNEDFQFYDLLFNYKYLVKQNSSSLILSIG